MKKFLAILMTLALVLSCAVGLTVSSSAAELESYYYEEQYRWRDASEADFGSHKVDSDGKIEGGQAFFGDGLWTLEWYDTETSVFSPMSAYFDRMREGWKHGGWAKFYTATVESAWNESGSNYCSVASNGKRLYPGDTAGAVVTFIVPISGKISYNASLYPYGAHNTSDQENGGDAVYLYVNDTMVWPANADDAVFYTDTASKDNPVEINHSSFTVNKGDKVRLVLTTKPGTDNSSKGCDFVDFPVVTYHSAWLADGSNLKPIAVAPCDIVTTNAKDKEVKVSWSAANYAAGYNVYVDGEKVNTELITALEYVILGLEPDKLYELTMTTVVLDGRESAPSDPQLFRTEKDVGDPIIGDVGHDCEYGKFFEDPTVSEPSSVSDIPSVDNLPKDESSFPILWIVIAAVVAVVVIGAAVAVFFIIKKKKAQ